MVEDRVTTAFLNSSVELRCFVRGIPFFLFQVFLLSLEYFISKTSIKSILLGTGRDIYLKWTRADGKPLPSSHRLQDGVLYIPNVQHEDAGEYSCLGIVEGDIILFTATARLAIVGMHHFLYT